MNPDEIKKKIAQIESQQRETQAELENLKKIISEPKPKTPEQKKKFGEFYSDLAKKQADFRELKRLKGR